jgi:hypothetical protein
MIIVNDEKLKIDPIGYIQGLLELYIEIDKTMVECFDSNKLFTDARNRAFIDILNIFEGTPKYLAAYCHD